MKYKTLMTAMLAAILLFTLTACSKTQPPAASIDPDSAAQQAERQSVPESYEEQAAPEPSEAETVPTSGDEVSGGETWKADFEKSLFENYGVIPEYYEDLGNGIFQVYVEVGGKAVPYVTVDSATGDYHG